MASDFNWCRLDSSGLLRFEGPDAQAFLQGQLTSNVGGLTAETSQYSGYCNPKGRLLAFLLLWRRDGAYHMMLPRELCEPVRKRLSMYILRARVKAVDISNDHVLFGLVGNGAMPALVTPATFPERVHGVVHAGNISMLKLPLNRHLLVASAAAAGTIEHSLRTIANAAPGEWWSRLEIEAGIPSVVAATQEQFVPQTVNLDAIGAVSFDKGCYPGQEIVARTHYLGKLKQRMVRAGIATPETPRAGDKLYSATFGDQASGMIISAVRIDGHSHEVLAVAHTADTGVRWKSPMGPALDVRALPYPLP